MKCMEFKAVLFNIHQQWLLHRQKHVAEKIEKEKEAEANLEFHYKILKEKKVLAVIFGSKENIFLVGVALALKL